MKRRLARRLIALAAAYAVVLNAWLPPLAGFLTLPAGDEPGAAVICATVPGNAAPTGDLPQKRLPPCPWGAACSMPGCTATALPGVDSVAPANPPTGEARLAKVPTGSSTAVPWRGGKKLARAPPDA